MKKAISLNGRPKNSNKARGPRQHSPGYVPSFSNVLVANIKSGPREPKTIEEQIVSIQKNMKKLQRRIDRDKAFLHVPVSQETEAHQEARRKLSRWEGLMNKHIVELLMLKQRQDVIMNREATKFENRQKEESRGRVANQRGSMNKVIEDSIGTSGEVSGYHPLVKDHKKSTSKNIVYKKHDSKSPAWEKASEEWKKIVSEKGPRYARK